MRLLGAFIVPGFCRQRRTSAAWSAVIVLTVLVSLPGLAAAVLIASGDGRGNVAPPAEDPGWHYVGTRARNGMTVVYLGDGWVVTAKHVGADDVRLGGVVYRAVLGSDRLIVNEDSSLADLLLFRIEGNPTLPPLPRLRIARTAPRVGEPVLMIGHGSNRGAPIVRTLESGKSALGWEWGSGSTLRWGTNRVAELGGQINFRQTFTRAISTRFEAPPHATRFEAQAARGDSGGAVFARARAARTDATRQAHGECAVSDPSPGLPPAGGSCREKWELVGVMFAVSSDLKRRDDASIFGSHTYAADLAYYREQILSIVDAADSNSAGARGARAFVPSESEDVGHN